MAHATFLKLSGSPRKKLNAFTQVNICKVFSLWGLVLFARYASAENMNLVLIHLSLASLLWDIGKHHIPRFDAAERSVSSGAILLA